MPKVKVEIKSSLNKTQVLQRLKNEVINLSHAYENKISNFDIEWQGAQNPFHFKIEKILVTGAVFIEDGLVTVEGQIPFALIVFKRQIESKIKQHCEKIINN